MNDEKKDVCVIGEGGRHRVLVVEDSFEHRRHLIEHIQKRISLRPEPADIAIHKFDIQVSADCTFNGLTPPAPRKGPELDEKAQRRALERAGRRGRK